MSEQKLPRASLLNLDRIVKPLLILVIIGVVGNLAFCLWTTDRQKLAKLLNLDGRYLLVAMLLTLVPWLGHMVRTIMWTRFLGYRIGLVKLFKIVLANELAASITPTAIGGGPLKIAMLVQVGVRPGAAACLATLPTLEDTLFFVVGGTNCDDHFIVMESPDIQSDFRWNQSTLGVISLDCWFDWRRWTGAALPKVRIQNSEVGTTSRAVEGCRGRFFERLSDDWWDRQISPIVKCHHCRDTMDMSECCRCDAYR